MFGFGKKKAATEDLLAIATGELLPLTAVSDPVFSQKMMGDGYAIQPTKGQIVAPVAGTIKSVADTKHAIMLTTAGGLELMLHLGLDTVELKGAPFSLSVEPDTKVTAGQPIAQMDLAAVKAAGKETTVMLVITNMDQVAELTDFESKAVQAGEMVETATIK